MNTVKRKISSLLNFTKLFKNWNTALLCWYSTSKNSYTLQLRDGTLFKVRSGSSDIQMIIEIYKGKSYHLNLNKLDRNSVIIDIGANIGVFSVFISKFTGKQSRVFAFEPFPENFSFFNENVKINGFENLIKIFPFAVGKSNEDRFLNIDAGDNAMHSFYAESGSRISVKTITLEKIFIENDIGICDFLKIDCEGAEYEIILNSPAIILNKIKIISIEYHPHPPYTHLQLKEMLQENGFEITVNETASGFGFMDAVKK